MGFTLKVIEGPEQGRSYDFDRIEVTIGRTVDNDVVIPDPGISRQHMSIRDKGGAYIVKDLGSSNGTKLNGKLVKEEVLKPGDVISAGGVQLKFEGPTPGSASAAQRPVRERTGGRPVARQQGESGAQRPAVRNRSVTKAPPAAPAAVAPPASGQPVIRSKGIRRKEPPPEKAVPPKSEEAQQREDTAGRAKSGARGKRGKSSAGPLTKVVSWFKGLSKRNRILLFSATGLLVVLLAVAAFRQTKTLVDSVTDHSDEEFTPGEANASEQPISYGLGTVDKRCVWKVTFRFKYANGRATMMYKVAGVDNKQEVDIQLNGMHIEWAPITLGKWSDPIRLTMPRKHLLENALNKIAFINTVNSNDPKAQETWAVQVSAVDEQPLPAADLAKAKEAFETAKEQYRLREVAPANTFQALLNFRSARDFLELLEENKRPDFYSESNEFVERLEDELEKKYRALLFSAEQALEFGQTKKAKGIYQQIMMAIPDQEDPRYLYAKEKLDAMQ